MTTFVRADPERAREVSRACSRRLSPFGGTTPADDLRALLAEAERGGDADAYGEGGVVAEVEQEVRDLLRTPAALLVPSGTMAQQLALRHWCDLAGNRLVAMHATAHALLWEEDALPRLQGLEPVAVGDPRALPTVEELLAPEPAVVLVELPQRETGGQLWPLHELRRLSRECRARGVRLHVDGARLWDCAPAYGDLAEVVALADSTYLSLYKRLGSSAGALLVGGDDVVSSVRTWRRRAGGTLPALWPLALAARRGLREVLPVIPALVAHAQAVADAVVAGGGEVVVRPETPLLHVVLPAAPEVAVRHVLDVSAESGIWLGGGARPGPRAGTAALEIALGEPSLAVAPDEAADVLLRLCRACEGPGG